MKICIVGPGTMPIPPKGWGAVEILIDDYRKTLTNLGHQVEIVNTRNPNLIVSLVNALNPDFVHIQYDEHVHVIPHLLCKNVAITSHYGYLEQPHRWDPSYRNIFWGFVNTTARIFCLSPGIAEVYSKAGIPDNRLCVVPNGVRTDLFKFIDSCRYPDRTLYLAKVDPRKRQSKLQRIEGLYFAGNCVDPQFNTNNDRYLGEWDKETLYSSLTDYANLALLSDGEAHPLVCLESLSAGLGLVLSECATANLDLNKSFIDVVPEEKLNDEVYVAKVLEDNRLKSVSQRQQIREYAKSFDWSNIIKDIYLKAVFTNDSGNKITG